MVIRSSLSFLELVGLRGEKDFAGKQMKNMTLFFFGNLRTTRVLYKQRLGPTGENLDEHWISDIGLLFKEHVQQLYQP